jgi:outer membrane protein OmpA-like peptidoglycan-associated protein
MLVAAGWLLAGCSTFSSMNPVNWWHRQEGGAIAKERPAPPGADQPYPNIASVPAKPSPPDAKEMKELTDSLVADRTHAQHEAEAAPLADPSSPTASPNLFGVGTAPPPPPPGATPPAKSGTSGSPGTPPSPAPRKPVQSTPLAAPPTSSPTASGQPAPASAAPPAKTASAVPPEAATPGADASPAGPPPTMPAAPPPRPAVAGPPPVAVVTPKPMPTPSSGTSATIVFLNDASNLTPPAADEVKAFAAKRGKGTISVIGYGDSASSDPDAQSAAVNLGLSRAQSIVTVLRAAGVPDTAIRVSAEASGRGAALQVLQ